MNHQDWTPVTISKPKTREQLIREGHRTIEKKDNGGGNKQTSHDMSTRALETEEIPHLVTTGLDLGKAISSARSSKKLNQADLARLCNVNAGVIRDYENGSAIVESEVLNKINKVLGINLKKPKKVKKAEVK
jgi:ribosome-binding protein aMBF1 (putative translation factor)